MSESGYRAGLSPAAVTDFADFTDRRRARMAGTDAVPEWLTAPSCTSPALHPNGRTLAYVSDLDGQPSVWLAAVVASSGSQTLPVRIDSGPGQVRTVGWSPDGRWLVCLVAPFGGERTRVLALRPDGSDMRVLAGGPEAAGVTGAWRPDGGLVGVSESGRSDGGTTTTYLVDPGSGARTPLTSGAAAVVCAVHSDGRRAVVRVGERDRRQLLLVDARTGATTPLLAEGDATVADARFSPGGERLVVRTDSGRERVALLAGPVPEAGPARLTELAARPDADVDDFTCRGEHVAVVWNERGRSTVEVLGGGRIMAEPAEVVTGCAFTPDGYSLLLGVESPGEPPHVVLHRLTDGRRERLAPTVSPSWDPDELVHPEELSYLAEDGLELSGWWYRPRRVSGPAPTILWLHGGPEAQERPTFAPLLQALAAAGVAVFAPNVRGSTGYGRCFERADNHDGRWAAISDVAATARFLARAGLADEDRLGVAGRSYGGYLTLAALVHHPDLFRVGVDICGMADLETFFAYTEPWIAAAATSKYGDPSTDRELLRALSPLHRVDRLVAPLLVVHGEHDTNVPLVEAEQVVTALRERGAAPGLLVFDDEGHEIHGTANRIRLVGEVVAWLTGHLRDVDEQTA